MTEASFLIVCTLIHFGSSRFRLTVNCPHSPNSIEITMLSAELATSLFKSNSRFMKKIESTGPTDPLEPHFLHTTILKTNNLFLLPTSCNQLHIHKRTPYSYAMATKFTQESFLRCQYLPFLFQMFIDTLRMLIVWCDRRVYFCRSHDDVSSGRIVLLCLVILTLKSLSIFRVYS